MISTTVEPTLAGPPDGASEIAELAWPYPLQHFQIAGINKLLNQPWVLLADEMGLGKTIQAIAALRILHHRSLLASAALIVLPAGLILQWQRQLWRWAPELRLSTVLGSSEHRAERWRASADIYLVSYDSLRADSSGREAWHPLKRHWEVVIADEAQRFKNPKSEVAIVIKRLHRTRSWALTGTPIENAIGDLVSVLEFVAPGRYAPETLIAGLRSLLAEVQLRRRRADVLLDLPPKTVHLIDIHLGSEQRAAYTRAEADGIIWLRNLGHRLTITHVLELILRLKQICNICPETGQSAKLNDMSGRLEALSAKGEKTLVFSQFMAEPFGIEALASRLSRFRPVVLTGALDPHIRDQRVRIFERDAERCVMLVSLRAGGVGLNLTCASNVFHFDRWWNPALESQAEDRAHRMGQTLPVQVFVYQAANTIEEGIGAILTKKRAIFRDIIDGVDTDNLRKLDLQELLDAVAGTIRRWN